MQRILTKTFCAAIFYAVSFTPLMAADAPPPLPPLPPLPGEMSTPALPSAAPSNTASSNSLPELTLPSVRPAPSIAQRAPSIQPLPVPPLPGSTVSSSTMPPLPSLNAPASIPAPSAKTAPAITPLPSESADNADTEEEEKPAKHHHVAQSSSNVETAATAHWLHPTYYISEPLPEAIYRKSYDRFNKHLPVAYYERDYDTMVFTTAAHNDLNGLRSLLDNGRNVELIDVSGDTPLLVAVKHNAINTARLLLARHANPEVMDRSGMTPLQIAIRMRNYPMQRALQEMGACPSPTQMSAN